MASDEQARREEDGKQDPKPQEAAAVESIPAPDYVLDLLMDMKENGGEYQFPIDAIDAKDKFSAAKLLRRKLIETRNRYQYARLSVHEEWESDSMAFLEAGIHPGIMATGASLCGGGLLAIFTAKQREVETEFRNVLNIWMEYQRVWKETRSPDKALKAIHERMHAAGFLFVGVDENVPITGFSVQEFLQWANELEVGKDVPEKTLLDRVKAAGLWLTDIENIRRIQFKAYGGHIYESFLDNYRPKTLVRTFREAWSGGMDVLRVLQEFKILSNKHRPAYLGSVPHEELLKAHPLMEDFDNKEYRSLREALPVRVGMTKLRAATVTFANGFWIFNAGMFATNLTALVKGDLSHAPWVAANIWSLNRSLGPIRDICHALRHDFNVIESKRAQLAVTKLHLQDLVDKKEKDKAKTKEADKTPPPPSPPPPGDYPPEPL
jgi:hypothetical protein